MADERDDDDQVIESEEATAGGPQSHDSTGVRLRSLTRDMLSPDELDKRQKRIKTKRRTGGPSLRKSLRSGRRASADAQAEDIPPTETEEPPGPPPPPSP